MKGEGKKDRERERGGGERERERVIERESERERERERERFPLIYHQDCEVCEVTAGTSHCTILNSDCLTTSSRPALKVKVPRRTYFRTRHEDTL